MLAIRQFDCFQMEGHKWFFYVILVCDYSTAVEVKSESLRKKRKGEKPLSPPEHAMGIYRLGVPWIRIRALIATSVWSEDAETSSWCDPGAKWQAASQWAEGS